MSGISTHILDTSNGRPAPNVRVHLFLNDRNLSSAVTNADGRCSALVPSGVELEIGIYRLLFETGSYFADSFYPEVNISFFVNDPSAHYHVPLLISPFGFTTYRGL